MIKILHTSDWHLGHTLYDFDRTEEQTSMLDQMVSIVKAEQPDAVLVSGDVYHTAQPSASVQTLFSDTMVRMHDACPKTTIIVTAGNHDSGSRHEIFRTPWQALNVYTIGCLDREHPENHIISLPGKGHIIAMPYCYERLLPEGLFQQLIDLASERNPNQLPIILMAHTTVNGCDFTGHKDANERNVGGIDSLSLDALGQGYDYLALGHIHHAQFVHSGRHNVRYSGTPVAVSFDEAYPHSVTMVEIDSHGATPHTRTVDIVNPHPLVTLPAQGYASWDEAKQLLADFPDDIPAYIRLNVETETFLPATANADALTLTKGKQCRFCYINARRKDRARTDAKTLTVEEFKQERPIDIARRYAEDKGIAFTDEMSQLFDQVLKMVEGDTSNK